MQIVLQGGASRQDHQKKERHTTKETTNSAAKKNDNQLYNLLKKTILPFQTDKVLKESLHMFEF